MWAEEGEIAFGLKCINHGEIRLPSEEKAKLEAIAPVSHNTLGFELDCECDLMPYVLETFTADKHMNAEYQCGHHAPRCERYQEPCRFKAGERVLCLMHEGFDAVFPGVVVGPLSEEYLRPQYEIDEVMQEGYDSVDNLVKGWLDWNWNTVIIKPLDRLKNTWNEEMGDTVMVNRGYLFPYKKFEV